MRKWVPFDGRWCALFLDRDVRLHFVLCEDVKDVTVVQAFKSEELGRRAMDSYEFKEHWLGYEPQLVRYEALREFADYHRRSHWAFVAQPVLFFGSEPEMDWVAGLTFRRNMAFDRKRNIWLPAHKLGENRPKESAA